MLDWNDIHKYRENNRIEAKKAVGGLPVSLWETYSAFANTIGGYILLGVEELKDKSFRTVALPSPEKLVAEFWNLVSNQQKVSVNILSDKNVRIIEADGNRIVVIEVPRAQRSDKPVYINNNPLTGSYRRNGEGDYHCTKEEITAMYRDAAARTQDMIVLDTMDLSVFDYESVNRYRIRMKYNRPGHVWESLDDEEFLHKLGAVARGEDGHLRPTGAGLLMFGYEYEIVREYPYYFLDYQEHFDPSIRWTDRIISSSGDWSGNLFDFYFRVYNRISQEIKIPFRIENGTDRIDDTPVHTALREVLANCLVNADYYGPRGLVIIKSRDKITVSNPGGFRIDIKEALSGGTSDPRNATLIKMFNLINIGERAGSGIPNIYAVWAAQGWAAPVFEEVFGPDRTALSLEVAPIAAENGDKTAIKNGDKKTAIIEYLTDNVTCKTSDISALLGLKPSRTRAYLSALVNEDLVVAEGANRNRVYRLKA